MKQVPFDFTASSEPPEANVINLTSRAFASCLIQAVRGESMIDAQAMREMLEALWNSAMAGDACLKLNAVQLKHLTGEPWSRLLGEQAPLVLEWSHLYLHRFWHAERRVEQAIRARLSTSGVTKLKSGSQNASGLEAQKVSERFLRGLDAKQSQALQMGMKTRLTVIYGGPGTGKTRTLASLIASFADQKRQAVWVAAPTAKAGARLMESLALSLPSFDLSAEATKFLPIQALTIQRLVRQLPKKGAFQAYVDGRVITPSEHPGLVIVDEASMMSLELCDQLLLALGEKSNLVLVGDPHQLRSVELGSVFASLCEAQLVPLQAARVRLEKNFRQADRPALSAMSDAILNASVGPEHFSREATLLPLSLKTLVLESARRYDQLLSVPPRLAPKEPLDVDQLDLKARAGFYLAASKNYRLLSARRTGFAGADRLSRAILQRIATNRGLPADTWFEGRLITITKNDPNTGLFNGDAGVCVQGAHGEALIAFERSVGLLLLRPTSLPEFKDAYCLSVHQAQGSEFERIDFIAAPQHHALANRELLYTAVTRAKSELRVFGEIEDIRWAASHSNERSSLLKARLDHTV